VIYVALRSTNETGVHYSRGRAHSRRTRTRHMSYLVEEFLVAVQQCDEVDVFVEVAVKTSNVVHDSCFLFVRRAHVRRQQAMNTQDLTLFQRECHALGKPQEHNSTLAQAMQLNTTIVDCFQGTLDFWS